MIRKAANYTELLRVAPAILGIQPVESVVLLPLVDNKINAAMRVDLPDSRALPEAPTASTIVGMILRLKHIEGVVIVQYTGKPASETLSLSNALIAESEKCGLRVADSLYVAGDGFGSHLQGGEPLPLSDLEVPDDLAHLVQPGDQNSLVFPDPVPGVVQILDALVFGPDSEFPTQFFERVLVDEGAGSPSLSPADLATLALFLSRPSLRDVALTQWATNLFTGIAAFTAQIAWDEGEEYPAELAQIIMGEADRPDPQRLRAAFTACLTAAVSVNEQDRPGPLTAAGWISWASGRSTHAQILLDQALAIDPEYGMAQIIRSFIDSGHVPAWAFAN